AWISDREIAYRSVTAALSDLAAMAALPIGVLVAIQLPPGGKEEAFLADVSAGIGDAVRIVDTFVIGGNLARGKNEDDFAITTTVIGSAFEPIGRAGAQPGDL